MKMKVEVEVSKETYEAGQALATFVTKFKAALADGWQPGQDLPEILSSALADLAPGMQGVEQVKAESEEDKQAFANAIYVSLSPVAFAMAK